MFLPTGLRLIVKRTGRKASFTYEEDFKDMKLPTGEKYKAADVVRTTVELAKHVVPKGVKIEVIKKTTLRMTGKADYDFIAKFISDEFFCWSTYAEMTLQQLIGNFVATTAELKRLQAMKG